MFAETYANSLKEVWVITGPIYDADVQKLEAGNEIPDAFFKIVLDVKRKTVRALAWIIPQSASTEAPKEFLVSVDEVERQAGLDFHSWLDDNAESEFESVVPVAGW